jgi:metal-dependent amidase/aminoacylase/carboxypeptidase family protein
MSNSQPNTAINAAIDADAERLIGIFKDLHQNPELGFMEVRTASIVARELEALGYDVKTGIGKTGVVGMLRNGDGPVVMYRADMDCNAVITVGSVQAGNDNNVIPSSALLKINLRWFTEEDRSTMLAAIEQINQSIASAYNLPAELYPTTLMKGSAKVLTIAISFC